MWIFIGATNKTMDNFIGKKMELSIRTKKDSGHKVLYAHKPEKEEDWYFYTSTVINVARNSHFEEMLEYLEVSTRNSIYRFVKRLD